MAQKTPELINTLITMTCGICHGIGKARLVVDGKATFPECPQCNGMGRVTVLARVGDAYSLAQTFSLTVTKEGK